MKELLPINKRTMEHFAAAFEGPELQPIVELQVCKTKETTVLHSNGISCSIGQELIAV